jgi:hypothetical protein
VLIARAIILALTFATVLCLWLERPSPAPSYPNVQYCVIAYKALARDQLGNAHKIWVQGYGPCSQLDRYENA